MRISDWSSDVCSSDLMESERALCRAGLKTVGEVASRPMEIIAARFGEEAATALRRLTGEAESALIPRRAAPPLFVERRFAEPVAKTEYALQILEELSRQIVLQQIGRASGRERVGQDVEISVVA